MSHDHPQLQGLGSAPRDTGKYKVFTERIAALKKMGLKEGGENRCCESTYLYLKTHCVPDTVLCTLCALSSILTTSEGGRGYCPHFADEEPETREVKDLPKGTQLILGWRQLLNPDLNGSNSYALWVRHA